MKKLNILLGVFTTLAVLFSAQQNPTAITKTFAAIFILAAITVLIIKEQRRTNK